MPVAKTPAKTSKMVPPADGPMLEGEKRIPIFSLCHDTYNGGKVAPPHAALREVLVSTAKSYRWVREVSVEYGRGSPYCNGNAWWVIVDRVAGNPIQNEDIHNMLEGIVTGWNAAAKTARAKPTY